MNRHLLARTAFDILVADLEGHGNILSAMHRAALLELLDTFAGYCADDLHGRRAFPLPTGMGKTSAVVAFIAALERLRYQVPVSVAASKVEALAGLYEDLVAHGVPAERIGIKHSVPGTRIESTGNAEHLYQLVTHARVRGGTDFDLFGKYKDQRRPLTIYDETLMRSDAFSFSARVLGRAAAVLAYEASQVPELAELSSFVSAAVARIDAAVAKLSGEDPHSNGLALALDKPEEATIAAWLIQLAQLRGNQGLQGLAEVMVQFLGIVREELQVFEADNAGGIVSVKTSVPEALRNVVVLDASGPIRELVHMDPTITLQDSFDLAELKSFEDVQVHQVMAAGGRSIIEGTAKGERKESHAAALEVVGIIKRELEQDPQRAILVFTFLPRASADTRMQIQREMRRRGLDPDEYRPDGKPRFAFLTWGQHEGLNGYEYCETVVLAGVLHRSHLDIAASMKAQVGHLAQPTPSSVVRRVIESEVAHACYQAASRGSCRRVVNGRAKPMNLWLVHKSLKLKPIMDRVMPGAVWSFLAPTYLAKAAADGRTAVTLGRLLEHLRGVPEGIDKLSTKSLKAALALPDDTASKNAFTRAVQALELVEHGWVLEARSLVRGAVAFGLHG